MLVFSNEDENVPGLLSLRSDDVLAFFPTQIRKLRKTVRESSINLLQVYSTVSMTADKKLSRVLTRR